VAESDWYSNVFATIDSANASLRRLRFIHSGRIFERAMMDLYRDVSKLAKFLAAVGGPYFVTEIRRILANFRRDWEGYKMGVIPFDDLYATVGILISEVKSSLEVSAWLPKQFRA